MNIIKTFLFGPESKHDADIPYTYEARCLIIEGETEYNSYFADTVCGLIAYVKSNGYSPNRLSLHEIYKNKESEISKHKYIDSNKNWLDKPSLCSSFKTIYPKHISHNGCKFEDRRPDGIG